MEEQESNADVFEQLENGDQILYDGIKKPVTVVAGYKEGMEQIEDLENIESPTVLVEGPRGGQKMLNQARNDPDAIRLSTFSLATNGEWIDNLRIVG